MKFQLTKLGDMLWVPPKEVHNCTQKYRARLGSNIQQHHTRNSPNTKTTVKHEYIMRSWVCRTVTVNKVVQKHIHPLNTLHHKQTNTWEKVQEREREGGGGQRDDQSDKTSKTRQTRQARPDKQDKAGSTKVPKCWLDQKRQKRNLLEQSSPW